MTTGKESRRTDDEVARRALERYRFSERASIELINLSENSTYRVADPALGRPAILRVHRIGYHDRSAILSELDWAAAVRTEAGIDTPVVIATPDGERVVTLGVRGVERHCVLVEEIPGTEPHAGSPVGEDFAALGAITARLHRHSRGWERPAGFTRFSWDWQHSLGSSPRWGCWQDGIDVGPREEGVLSAAAELVHERLRAFGSSPDRFGLVHADLRSANLLVEGEKMRVIDFDDCGFSWFMYDFGAAVSFIEHDPRLGRWGDAWLRGYESITPLSEEDKQMLATFVMLRRMLLLAWLGSHSHSRESQQIGAGYTAGSCELAERFLASGGLGLT